VQWIQRKARKYLRGRLVQKKRIKSMLKQEADNLMRAIKSLLDQ
jgi:hypothetical protein